MNADIQTLRANLSNLSAGDLKFAASLIDQLDRRNNLSGRQWDWVTKLAARATGAEPAPAAVELPAMSGIIALFAKASEHLKHPKIRLQLDDGRALCLSVAGAQSKAQGSVNLTDGGRFGSNVWYGRVSPDGKWNQGKSIDARTSVQVSALLCDLAADPAGVASRHGRLTGNCCFCNTGLTDDRSTQVGYGPICAKHYGLPWGTTGKEG